MHVFWFSECAPAPAGYQFRALPRQQFHALPWIALLGRRPV